jgi:hypothetical protein
MGDLCSFSKKERDLNYIINISAARSFSLEPSDHLARQKPERWVLSLWVAAD